MVSIMHWPAIAAARHSTLPRVPFHIEGASGGRKVSHLTGSVAEAHLDALARWPEALRIDGHAVTLTLPAVDREPFFAQANAALLDAGLITAWRGETYPVLALDTRRLLATFERAASRFWGTMTFGAHCNGYVADGAGRPAQLWIARRSPTKATDPGRLDNLIGGGVPHGQSAAEAIVREGWEEAGLRPEQMHGLAPGRVLHIARDIAEGYQLEEVSVFDLRLPADLQPSNQDGEVASLMLLPIAQALALAASREMTVDAALATLDFALRHRLLRDDVHSAMSAASADLWRGTVRII